MEWKFDLRLFKYLKRLMLSPKLPKNLQKKKRLFYVVKYKKNPTFDNIFWPSRLAKTNYEDQLNSDEETILRDTG